MAAAIAAVEGSRQCVKALERRSTEATAADEAAGEGKAEAGGGKSEDGEAAPGASADDSADEEPRPPREEPPLRRHLPTPEEAAAAAAKRSVAQRNNNHKVLQRLNAEILGHQRNVRQFLQANRQLIPQVSGE